jgi:uncharacterized protein
VEQTFAWDPWKAALNERKHGVTFLEAATVFRDPLLLAMPDLAHSQEEERWVALGLSGSSILLVVAYTEEDRHIRIISARKAEPKERRRYEQS